MSRHALKATIPVGDPDLGAEIDVVISYEFRAGSKDHWDRGLGGWLPGDPCELEFLSARRPSDVGPLDKLMQDTLDHLAQQYFESDYGQFAAIEQAADDLAAARERAAEERADR